MDREQSSEGQGQGAGSDSDYEQLRYLGIRLIDAIARLLRAGKEERA